MRISPVILLTMKLGNTIPIKKPIYASTKHEYSENITRVHKELFDNKRNQKN